MFLLDDFQQDLISSFFALDMLFFFFYLNLVKANKMQARYGCRINVTLHHKKY